MSAWSSFKTCLKHPRFLLPWIAVCTLFLLMLLPRCAQIVAPTGGAKDSIPPVLLKVTPPDSTLNFDGKTVNFEFDEFIELKDLQKQLIISPNPEKRPDIQAKLRTLTIKWDKTDTLKENTTYIYNFGDALVDVNEGNKFKNFRYVFSTGDYLDSLEIHGRVIDAETGLPDSTAMIILYFEQKDSVVTQDKPDYYTFPDSTGLFSFGNLPSDTFKVFALRDENGDLKYTDNKEAIAFLKDPLILDTTGQDGLLLQLFQEHEEEEETTTDQPQKKKRKGDKEKEEERKFEIQGAGATQDLKKPYRITFSQRVDTLFQERMTLEEDSTFKEVPFEMKMDTARKQASLRYDWKEGMAYRLLLDSAFAIDTSGLVYAKKDTLNFKTKTQSDYGTLILHFKIDSLRGLLSDSVTKHNLGHKFDSLAVIEDSLIEIKDSIFEHIREKIRVVDSISFAEEDPKGEKFVAQKDSLIVVRDSLTRGVDSLIKFNNLEAQALNPENNYQLTLFLFNDKTPVDTVVLQGDTYKRSYLDPGKYKVRIVRDVNFNGRWDRGCYYCPVKRQPEQGFSIEEEFEIKANWENDFPDLEIHFLQGTTE